MNMSIQNNLAAMNANRMLNITGKKKTKSTERLSSGYRINRAADDAAGLAISEKMRRQIKGLNQASRNIQDGISLCQVADGALNETQDILQRMNVLAVQSANGTNSDQDREYLQQEVSNLIDEIDRVANETSFNEEIYPLHFTDRLKLSFPVQEITKTYEVVDRNDPSRSFEPITLQGLLLGSTTNIAYKIRSMSPDVTSLDISEISDIGSLTKSDLKIDEEGVLYVDDLLETGRGYFILVNDSWVDAWGENAREDPSLIDAYHGAGTWKWANASLDSQNSIYIQAGVEAGQGIYLNMVDATASSLAIKDVNVSSEIGAEMAIDRIKGAIKKVSEFRSDFGAYQNRLEHAYNINQNSAENTQYAESQIRDTDMAMEMVDYSNNNIIEQAGTSMLSQANQSKQGLLSLLQ